MNRVAALVLVVALVVTARHVAADDAGRFATMALGFILIAAAIVGEAASRVRLPRLTGYLVTGLALGPSVLNVLSPRMARELDLVNGLAVALIAFSAGVEMDLEALRASWKSLARHGGFLIGGLFAGLFAVALLVSPWVSFTAGLPWARRIAVALVFAAVMATFSPVVTVAVLAETRARGKLAERTLALVVMGDLALVVLFTVSTAVAHLLDERGSARLGVGMLLGKAAGHVAFEVLGSLVAGIIAGVAVAIYRRLVHRRSGLMVVATCLVIAEVGSRLGLSSILTSVMAGVIVRNVASEAAQEMQDVLEHVRVPVLVVFFAAAGASLHLAQLMELLPVVLGTVLVRAGLIQVMNRVGARAGGVPAPVARNVPAGLISQAGVTVGLVIVVAESFGAWGRAIETLSLAVISLHELIGPIVFRAALARLGEIPPAETAPAEPQPG